MASVRDGGSQRERRPALPSPTSSNVMEIIRNDYNYRAGRASHVAFRSGDRFSARRLQEPSRRRKALGVRIGGRACFRSVRCGSPETMKCVSAARAKATR